jgi:hypothetical protein
MNERLLIALAAVALAACSGAAPQLLDSPRDEDAGASATGPGTTGSSSSGSGSTSGSSGNGSSGTGNGNGSSGQGSSGGGSDFDAGVAPASCPAGGTEQTSASGDSASDPTPFDTIACGSLAAGDSYFWTFTLPASATKFGLAFTGGIRIELTLNGNTMDVVPGATLPFRTKDPYYLRITPEGSLSQSYVLVVTEK